MRNIYVICHAYNIHIIYQLYIIIYKIKCKNIVIMII